MRYLRCADVKRLLLLLAALTAVCTTAGLAAGAAAGWAVLAVCLLFSGVCLGNTLWRHRQMARLADYLRRITAGEYSLDIRDHTEGELSLLKSEIYKVTMMLSEYNERLQREKRQLADSMADISHQLKTPLTSMLVMTDLLSQEGLPAEKREEFTRHIRRQLERLEWLVSALLKIARLDAGVVEMKPERVEIGPFVREVTAPLLIPIELKEQTLTLRGKKEAALWGDPHWSAEALLNVVKNCTEHTPAGGEITVSWEENPLYTEVRVEDTGPGVDPADLPHIFNRFYRGKNACEDSGAGIGLAMAQSILSRQNGEITAENRPGGGTRFRMRLYKTVV